MKAAQFTVNGEEASLGALWVHLKSKISPTAVPFTLLVNGEFVVDVFVGKAGKPDELTWVELIQSRLNEFGNFAAASYVQTLMELDEVVEEKKRWVLISIENVRVVDKGVLLEGLVEGFRPTEVPVLKPIR